MISTGGVLAAPFALPAAVFAARAVPVGIGVPGTAVGVGAGRGAGWPASAVAVVRLLVRPGRYAL